MRNESQAFLSLLTFSLRRLTLGIRVNMVDLPISQHFSVQISQCFSVPSKLLVINPSPLGKKAAIPSTMPAWPFNSATRCRDRKFHMRTSPRSLPAAAFFPSGLTRTDKIALLESPNIHEEPSRTFHVRTVLSSEPEMRNHPLGEKSMDQMARRCPLKVFRTCFLRMSQI